MECLLQVGEMTKRYESGMQQPINAEAFFMDTQTTFDLLHLAKMGKRF
jgi:hypothetical protein